MKKLIVTLVAVVMVMAISVPVFAAGHEPKHPSVPQQSIGKISMNSVRGMHTAYGNVMYAEGVAAHVFENRFNPHN